MGNIIAKGIIYISSARVVFLISSYALHVFLGRFLGPADYGIIGIILALLTFFRIFLKDGLFHTVSRYTAAYQDHSLSIRGKGLKLQLVFILFLFTVFFISANLIAYFLHDPKFLPYIRLSAFILPPMGIYFIYMASLNGLRLFHKQALGTGFYGVMRFLFVFCLIMAGFKIKGAIVGLVMAPLIASILVRHLCISSEPDQKGPFYLDIKEIILFATPIVLFSAGLTITMSLDLFLVKSILQKDNLTGFYTAATTIGKLPYHFILAFTLTLFPSISKAHALQKTEQIRNYIRRSVKFISLILIPITIIISITSKDLISLIYSKRFIQASQPLSIIICGYTFLAYFMLFSTVLTAIGRPKVPLYFLFGTLPLDFILNLKFIPRYQLIGASLATSISHLTGMVLSAAYTIKHFEIHVSAKTIFSIILGISFIIGLSYILPSSGFFLLLKYVILISVYGIIIFIRRELKPEDIDLFKEILFKTKRNQA